MKKRTIKAALQQTIISPPQNQNIHNHFYLLLKNPQGPALRIKSRIVQKSPASQIKSTAHSRNQFSAKRKPK
jgi:hypothetical protein